MHQTVSVYKNNVRVPVCFSVTVFPCFLHRTPIILCHPRKLLCPFSVLQTSSRWSHLTLSPSDCSGKMPFVGVNGLLASHTKLTSWFQSHMMALRLYQSPFVLITTLPQLQTRCTSFLLNSKLNSLKTASPTTTLTPQGMQRKWSHYTTGKTSSVVLECRTVELPHDLAFFFPLVDCALETIYILKI